MEMYHFYKLNMIKMRIHEKINYNKYKVDFINNCYFL
jgi:hypothetical protein